VVACHAEAHKYKLHPCSGFFESFDSLILNTWVIDEPIFYL
jgi:hypothetical protein